MNALWLRIVGPLVSCPAGPAPPRLDALTLPRPARMVPGAQAAIDGVIAAFNRDVGEWAGGIKVLVWEAGLTAGAIMYGLPVGLLCLAIGWWMRGQYARIVIEYHATQQRIEK